LPPVNRFLYRAITRDLNDASVSASAPSVVVPVTIAVPVNAGSGVIIDNSAPSSMLPMSPYVCAVNVHSTYPPEPITPPVVTRYTTPDDALNNVVPDVTDSPIVPYTFAVITA